MGGVAGLLRAGDAISLRVGMGWAAQSVANEMQFQPPNISPLRARCSAPDEL